MLYECTVKIRREVERPSTLPPPCYHCKPPPFRCPSNGCLPPEPQIPKRPSPCPPCILLIYKPRPICVPPPTICIATACKPPTPRVYCQPPPKLLPPPSGVQFCVNYTDTGFGCYHPSYWSSLSKCDTC
ncbi:hypothetical protein HN011_010288 [Eciton burchellii]|nr:hypothetical protein HN011_010288 [Eciton burchellii]